MIIRLPRAVFSALSGAMMLGGCGASDDGDGVGGVTAREADALNEAAEILDDREEIAAEALAGNISE
ncbi:MAG: hypothetical protein R3E04_02720 [Sphingobium sp.]